MSGLILAACLLVQAPIRTEPGTELRRVTLALLDAKDGQASDLEPTDVALSENGVVRDIASFERDVRPLSIAVLVDSSEAIGSNYRLDVVDAVGELVRSSPSGTRYALWTTGDRPSKILGFTEDRGAAGEALRHVYPTGGNTMLDALAEASADLAKSAREGDRTVVIAVSSSGRELSSRDKYGAVDEARRKAQLFLSVLIEEGEDDPDALANLGYAFGRLAAETGGLSETTLSAIGVDRALQEAGAVIRSGYRLAYATVPGIKKRKLELRIARPGAKALIPAPEGGPES